MAFNTKLELTNNKFYQLTGDTLSLCGHEYIGCAEYITNKSAYFNATPRAIPDVAWVTGKTSTSGIQTANNGLNKAGTNVRLGGALTGNTLISGAYTLSVCNGALLNTDAGYQISGVTMLRNPKASSNIALGQDALQIVTTGTNNIGIGPYALQDAKDSYVNVAIGVQALNSLTGGSTNVAIGYASLILSKIGYGNVAIGSSSGYGNAGNNNVFIGDSAGYANTTGSNNLFLGYCAGRNCNGSNLLVIANSDSCSLISGDFAAKCVSINGQLKITGVTSGAVTDKILVWNTTDKLVKCVNVATITGATAISAVNGLTKSGNEIKLGGTLTGTTTLTSAGGTALLQYGGNYSANYVARTIPDAGFVTGKTSLANCAIAIAPTAITGVTNGLTKVGSHDACLGGNVTTSVSVVPVAAATVSIGTATNYLRESTGCTTIYSMDGVSKSSIFGVSATQVQTLTIDTNTSNNASISMCATPATICMSAGNGGSQNTIVCQGMSGYTIRGCAGTFKGAQYFADYSAQFTPLSLVTKGYVTGLTTQGITSANNGLCKQGNNVKLGGALTGNTCISGAYVFGLNTNTTNISGATGGVNLGGSGIKLTATIPGSGGLLCLGAGGAVCQTSLSAFGGITGATNGIGTTGQKVCLGGDLIADTTIQSGAGSRKLTLGRFCGLNLATSGETDMILVAQGNGDVIIKSESGTGAISNGTTNAIGFNIDFNGTSGFNVFDNRAGAAQTGIVYSADYSLNYVPRSLVDKGYVDSVATGLQVHQAAIAATTGLINLATIGLGIIDGVQTTTGMRILVKNQTSGATNGIYSASTGTWGRTADFDGLPSGEVTNGDLIPVTSGSTQNSTIWVLVTPNPITVGTTPLNFTLFSTVVDVQAGAGIAITQVGGVHTVCVELGNGSSSGCGLSTAGTGLCVNPTIAGSGLTYTTGTLSVRAANGGSATSIPVKFNAGCCLVLNCADINGALNAITGATNGLTKSGQQVKLGGTVTGATTITLSATGTPSLLFTDSRIVPTGLQYTADYCNTFTCLSIPNVGFVTGKTAANYYNKTQINSYTGATNGRISTIESKYISGATNGLTKVGAHDVCLGGTITGSSTVTVLDGKTLYFGGDSSGVNYHGGRILVSTDATNPLLNNSCISSRYATCCSIINVVPTGITISSTLPTFGGACYASDLSPYFVDNSLITKKYVRSQTSGITTNAITGATNGLTKSGQKVCLGGALSIDTAVSGVGAGTYCMDFGTLANKLKEFNVNANCISLASVDGTSALQLLNNGTMKITDGTCSRGICYAADYSTNFVDNSLITKKYVCSQTSGITANAITSATNGLTKQGQQVKLGGALTGSTTVNGAQTMRFNVTNFNVTGSTAINLGTACVDITGAVKLESTPATGLSTDGFLVWNSGDKCVKQVNVGSIISASITGATNGLTKVGQKVVLGGSLTGATTIAAGTNDFSVTSSTGNITLGNTADSYIVINQNSDYVCLGNSAGAKLCTTSNSVVLTSTYTCIATTPPVGLTSDSVIVWNSVDKQLKTVSGAALGDKNNIYAKTTVAISTTLTTGSTYVQLINPSSGTTITLPSTPIDGQVFKLKDISGNALTFNIVIDAGGGKQIDNAQCALINTDFGALEIMYNGASSKWYSLAFVN
jgi:hypothetical protein